MMRFHLKLLLVCSVVWVSFGRRTMFLRISVGTTTSDTAYMKKTVDNEARCFGLCQYDEQCLSYDHDALSGNPSKECRFYKTSHHAAVGTLVSAPNVTYFSLVHRDCVDWYQAGSRQNGVYDILVARRYRLAVFCNMVIDGGGWIVFQRRFNGNVHFNRGWEEYKHGFGEVTGEHWLGNEHVHNLTKYEHHALYVQGCSFENEEHAYKYGRFSLDSEANFYQLSYSEESPGYDRFLFGTNHNGKYFSTHDNDHDDDSDSNCASGFQSGWWYYECFHSNLNGIYSTGTITEWYGLIWYKWKTQSVSLKTTLMMIRRR